MGRVENEDPGMELARASCKWRDAQHAMPNFSPL